MAAAIIAAVFVDFDLGLLFDVVDEDDDSSWVCGMDAEALAAEWDLFSLADFDLGKMSVALRLSLFDWSVVLLDEALWGCVFVASFFLF